MRMKRRSEDRFTKQDARIAAFAKAIAHPARVAILRTLAERNSCICGEIVDVLPLAQSTVSQHLRELQRVGLIKGEIDGPKSCYCIDQQVLAEATALLGEFLGIAGRSQAHGCRTE
jgi:ArsR family transcriptional regulator